MTSLEKNKTLSDFSASESAKGLRVLVSTSIIEVSFILGREGGEEGRGGGGDAVRAFSRERVRE